MDRPISYVSIITEKLVDMEPFALETDYNNNGSVDGNATLEFYLNDTEMAGEPATSSIIEMKSGSHGTTRITNNILPPGTYNLTVYLRPLEPTWDPDLTNNIAHTTFTVHEKPASSTDTTDDDAFLIPNIGWPAGTTGIALLAGLFGLGAVMGSATLWYNERSRWWLYLGFFMPLLSRIKREELEDPDKFKAGQLYQTIKLNPGINLTALSQLADMGNGTLIHHLSRLEHEGLIQSVKQGQLRLFYSTKKEMEDEKATKLRYLRDTQKRVLKLLNRHPESSQRDIADMLELKQQLVSYHLRELLRMGYIRRKGLRRFYSYSLEDGVGAQITLEGAG